MPQLVPSGSPEEFSYSELAPLIASIARRTARWNQSFAEDLFQEGMLAAWEAWRRYDPSRGVDLVAYMVTAARLKMLTAIVRWHRDPSSDQELEETEGIGADPEILTAAFEQRERMIEQTAAMLEYLEGANIPPRDVAIYRARIEGETLTSIALKSGLSKTGVSKALRRVLRLLGGKAPVQEQAQSRHTLEFEARIPV